MSTEAVRPPNPCLVIPSSHGLEPHTCGTLLAWGVAPVLWCRLVRLSRVAALPSIPELLAEEPPDDLVKAGGEPIMLQPGLRLLFEG